ncbi:MAG TPA: DUF6516 family protein [Candidatus Kapabacteria bacterium]|nr:DUF6516 family protein [Candidatus Kapabacteria bacterium]
MLGLVEELRLSGVFSDIKVLELIDEEGVKVIKIKAEVSDGTLLYIHEINRSTSYKYSYQWQENDGKIIKRWDNSPHWKNISTFPYHKHVGNEIFPCPKMTIIDVIDEIRKGR